MKLDSDNSRTSAIIKIINLLQEQGVSVVVFDDRVKKSLYKIPGVRWVSNLNELKKIVDLIISNRRYSELNEIKNLYTRDVFTRD
ncbi:UDP binding domain-containing protein [Leuconostoc mesenteroides]|uniref:UDP binding domain-containing protein n=1 Tax=Leuconostoc mesenteroides TaxID=1245 RepID=UPI00235E897E|nr:UDP binding domain-containing protein [Leuconostoc mesenteroides]